MNTNLSTNHIRIDREATDVRNEPCPNCGGGIDISMERWALSMTRPCPNCEIDLTIERAATSAGDGR